MASGSTIFTGASRYAKDFQSVIERSVNIASLPMMQMQQGKLTITDQAAALKALEGKVSFLQSALSKISDGFGSGSFSVSNSDAASVTARISDGATEGTYSIEVLDIGSYATASSKSDLNPVSDPTTENITEAGSFSLSVNGGTTISLDPDGDDLKSLVDAINSANAGVRATVVNLSPSGAPEYHLSIQSTSLGPTAISLKGDGVELLDSPTGGALARYSVNGRVEESVSSSRTVTLSTGLTVDLAKESASAVTIEVTRNTNSAKAAIDAFVTSYNGVIDELAKHYGTQKGALSGNSIIASTNNILRSISSYSTGNGGMSSLQSLGILTDKSGKLYVDNVEWDKVKNKIPNLQTFFGKTGTSGFLEAAGGQVDALRAAETGILTNAIQIADEQSTRADERIAEEQRRIDELTENLQKRFFAADSLIAQLEQQASYYINMFSAMKSNQDAMNG